MVQFYIYLLIFFVNGESEKNPVNNYKEAHYKDFKHKNQNNASVYLNFETSDIVFANGEKSCRAK